MIQTRDVTLLAPLPPYRGGIARHSNALLDALAGLGDITVHAESFSRLYPAFLYPGESARDTTQALTPKLSVSYDLDDLNPLSWRKVAKRIARRGGVLALPCWTFFTAPCLGWITRFVRHHGVRVVMIVHNVGDHEGAGWKNAITRWQLESADSFVTHSRELERQLREAGLKQPCEVVEHPPYSDFPPATGKLPKERALELLCFGLVRPYKGVDIALQALAQAGLDDVRLTIAGEIWEDVAKIQTLAQDERLADKVEIRNYYHSDEDTAELFGRADALLLPYRSVTGSGVLALAQHYCLPVIASDLEPLAQTIKRNRLGWTFPTSDINALASLISNEVTRSTCMERASIMMSPDDSGWKEMALAVTGAAKGLPVRSPSP